MVTVQRIVKLKLFTYSTEDPGKNSELRVVLQVFLFRFVYLRRSIMDSDSDSSGMSYADVVKRVSPSTSPPHLSNSCWLKFQVEDEEEAMQIPLQQSVNDQVNVCLPHCCFSDMRKENSLYFICFINSGEKINYQMMTALRLQPLDFKKTGKASHVRGYKSFCVLKKYM